MPAIRFPPAWMRRVLATVPECLILSAVMMELVALLVPAVQAVRDARRRSECSPGLKQPMPLHPPVPENKPVVVPPSRDTPVGGLPRSKIPERISRFLTKVRSGSSGMHRASHRFVRQPWSLHVLASILFMSGCAASMVKISRAKRVPPSRAARPHEQRCGQRGDSFHSAPTVKGATTS